MPIAYGMRNGMEEEKNEQFVTCLLKTFLSSYKRHGIMLHCARKPFLVFFALTKTTRFVPIDRCDMLFAETAILVAN